MQNTCALIFRDYDADTGKRLTEQRFYKPGELAHHLERNMQTGEPPLKHLYEVTDAAGIAWCATSWLAGYHARRKHPRRACAELTYRERHAGSDELTPVACNRIRVNLNDVETAANRLARHGILPPKAKPEFHHPDLEPIAGFPVFASYTDGRQKYFRA